MKWTLALMVSDNVRWDNHKREALNQHGLKQGRSWTHMLEIFHHIRCFFKPLQLQSGR